MTPTQRKAMEDARNALQRAAYATDRPDILGLCEQADDALRAALAEADEPVAWLWHGTLFKERPLVPEKMKTMQPIPLFTHPPRREPLTVTQIHDLSIQACEATPDTACRFLEMARLVEARHGIGGDE